jgi:hypothetical protein
MGDVSSCEALDAIGTTGRLRLENGRLHDDAVS